MRLRVRVLVVWGVQGGQGGLRAAAVRARRGHTTVRLDAQAGMLQLPQVLVSTYLFFLYPAHQFDPVHRVWEEKSRYL